MYLGPVVATGGQHELFVQAVTTFAERLGVSRPDVRLTLADPKAVVLVVHAAALLAVLDKTDAVSIQGRPFTAADVLNGLLEHEGRYWHKSAVARGLILDASVEQLAVAVACLIGADDEIDAAGLLARIPDLADAAERRGQAARWLHDLYPGTQPTVDARERDWIGSLRPDPVAERLVTSELSGRSSLVPSLFTGLNEHQALRALTVLGRAALTDSRAGDLLRRAFAADLENLAIPALTVAVETNPIVANLISDALAAQPVSDQVLEKIATALPYPTFALAETAADIFRHLVDKAAEGSSQRARRLVDLDRSLSDLGRRKRL